MAAQLHWFRASAVPSQMNVWQCWSGWMVSDIAPCKPFSPMSSKHCWPITCGFGLIAHHHIQVVVGIFNGGQELLTLVVEQEQDRNSDVSPAVPRHGEQRRRFAVCALVVICRLKYTYAQWKWKSTHKPTWLPIGEKQFRLNPDITLSTFVNFWMAYNRKSNILVIRYSTTPLNSWIANRKWLILFITWI